MADERIINCGIKATEEVVTEIEVEIRELSSITRQLTYKSQLFFPAKVDACKSAAATDLLRGDRAEIRQRLVVVNRANVIAPAIGDFGGALGQEQQMMRGAGRDRLEQSERGAIQEKLNHGFTRIKPYRTVLWRGRG